jgi:hypothetical protein
MFANGKTAIDAVATLGKGLSILDLVTSGVAPGCHFQIRIGRLIFLTAMSPAPRKRTSIRLPMLSLTIEETQMPPGSANSSSRAAIHITEIDSDPQYDLRLAQHFIRRRVV